MMTRSIFCLFVVALATFVSCRLHRPATVPDAATGRITHAETPPPSEIDRLLQLNPLLNRQYLTYRATEGDAHRGDAFSRLALQLDLTGTGGPPIGREAGPTDRARAIEVLSFLGLPDRGMSNGNNALYVYSFWREDKKSRWVAIVRIKDDVLEGIGWNEATVNDFSMMKTYSKWSDLLVPPL